MRLDLEFVAEHHPSPDGLKLIKAALKIPSEDVPSARGGARRLTALDHVAEKLERRSAITTGAAPPMAQGSTIPAGCVSALRRGR